MISGINLFEQLTDKTIDWLLENGQTEKIEKDEKIIVEGEDLDRIYLVLEGTLNISLLSLGNTKLTTLGSGELVGEIAFLEQLPATATATCIENCILLTIKFAELDNKISSDLEFAADFYKGLAHLGANRLRNTSHQFGQLFKGKIDNETSGNATWKKIAAAVREFKQTINKSEVIENSSDITSEEHQQNVLDCYDHLIITINDTIGPESQTPPSLQNEIGNWLQHEFLPYVMLTKIIQRAHEKPRGYAGDYKIIEKIYDNRISDLNNTGKLFDTCFINLPMAKAVSNRRKLIANEISQLLESKDKVEITVLASGPATEIFDVYASLDDKKRLKVNLIDVDLQALAYVSDQLKEKQLTSNVKLINESLIYLALGKQKINLSNQDFVYSMGLTDYLADKFVIKLMNFSHTILKPAGKLVLGNYHKNNVARGFLDHIVNWRLIYRTEEDMDKLYRSSDFNSPCSRIVFEEEGVDMFAENVKTGE